MKIRFLAAILLLVACALLAQTQTATPAGESIPDAEQFVGPPQGQPMSGEALHLKTQEVASLLRCPVCQGLSVADSPSEMAVNMKHQVNALLARGFTQEQILSYFERSYGQFVLLKPKFQGVNTMVWVIPILALAIGVVVVVGKMKKLEQEPVAPASTAKTDKAPESAEDPYLARVRDLVGGGKQ